MKIFVHRISGQRYEVEINENDTIEYAKECLCEKTGYIVEEVMFLFRGKQTPNHKKIRDCGIKDGSIVHLLRHDITPLQRRVFNLSRIVKNYKSWSDSKCSRGSVHKYSLSRDGIKVSNSVNILEKVLSPKENGPLVFIFSFLDIIELVTNIPSVCRIFHEVSNFCLRVGILKPQSYHMDIFYSRKKCRVSESLQEKIMDLCGKHIEPDFRVIQFLMEENYRISLFNYFRSLKRKLHDEEEIVDRSISLGLRAKDGEFVEFLFRDICKEMNLDLSVQQVLDILNELNFTTFEEFFYGEDDDGKRIYNFRFAETKDIQKLVLNRLFESKSENGTKVFKHILRKLLPPDEYEQKYTREREYDLDLIYGFKYRFEILCSGFFTNSFIFNLGRNNPIDSIHQLEILKFICSEKEFNVHPTEETRRIVDECFPRLPREMSELIEEMWMIEDTERYKSACEYKKNHKVIYLTRIEKAKQQQQQQQEKEEEDMIKEEQQKQKEEESEEEEEEGEDNNNNMFVKVYRKEEDFEMRKRMTKVILDKFWFADLFVSGGWDETSTKEREKFIFDKISHFLAFEQEDSWLAICSFRFQIEKFLLDTEFFDQVVLVVKEEDDNNNNNNNVKFEDVDYDPWKKINEEEEEEEEEESQVTEINNSREKYYKELEKMVDEYRKKWKEIDPMPNLRLHQKTVEKVKKDPELLRLMYNFLSLWDREGLRNDNI